MIPSTLSILLVDDSEDDNFFSRRAIKKSGVPANVAVCVDGSDAMDYLTHRGRYADVRPEHPDLIFLDVNMPRMDGWELIDALATTDVEMPSLAIIVMLTTSINPSDRERANASSLIAGFLNKPLTAENVCHAVTEHFGYHDAEDA